MAPAKEATPTRLSELERTRLEKAAGFCERLGFAVQEYPIRCCEFLGEEVLGRRREGDQVREPGP